MKYKNIKKMISLTMLFGLMFLNLNLNCIANEYQLSSNSATLLSGEVKLSDNNEIINLSLRDSDVKQVLRLFADKASMNIVFHSSVNGKVTLDLVNMPLNDAFNLLLQITGLNYYIQNNTLIVIAKDHADNANFSKQEMFVFQIKHVNASNIAQFLNTNIFGIKRAGLSSVEAATVNSATNELIVFGMKSDLAIINKVIEQLDREPLSKTFIVNHTTPAEMANMICNVLLPSRGINSSSSDSANADNKSSSKMDSLYTGGASSLDGGSMSEGSTTTSIKLGEGILACNITSSLKTSVATSFDMQNISISYYPQRGTITMIGGSEYQLKMVEDFIAKNDIKQPQAYLEVSIVELNEEGSKEFSNDWSVNSPAWAVKFNSGSVSGGRTSAPGGRWQDTIAYELVPGQWDATHTQYTPPQFIETPMKTQNYYGGNTYISWTMNYLIENRKARVLANPKLLITNGQPSIIDLTQDYVEKVTSEFLSTSTAGTVGAVQRTYTIGSDKGIKVELVPFISPEGYVTLNIKPNYSTEIAQVVTPSQVGTGTDLQATLLSRRDLELNNVRIKDGETLIIGGLIQESEQKTVQKIPVLGDLPVIGTIFRSSRTSKVKNELVIMLTPKIIVENEDAYHL